MSTESFPSREVFEGMVLGIAAVAILSMSGDAGRPTIDPQPAAYVDCAKTPDKSASVRFDAGKPNDFYIGDVQTNGTGLPVRWRRQEHSRQPSGQYEIDTLFEGIGSVTVSAGEFGMPVPYGALPMEGSFVASTPFLTDDNGQRVYVSQLPHPDISSKAPVLVTFACKPGVAGK